MPDTHVFRSSLFSQTPPFFEMKKMNFSFLNIAIQQQNN